MRLPPILGAALCVLATGPATAQFPPDSLVNLQVLPRDISVGELIGVMRGFALGLGVRCQYCHVGEEGLPLSEFDFPSDEKPTKRRARVMLEMLHDINDGYLTRLPERGTPTIAVQCATCHRGQSRPMMIEDVVLQVLNEHGADSAKARYRELRERSFGSYTYDFTEFTLTLAAQDLIGANEPDKAIVLLELNDEFFPNSAGIQFGLGEAYRVKGDRERAIAYYERTLELNANFPPARQRLSQLRGNR